VGAVESWLVAAGRDRRPGTPPNVRLYPASNFVLGGQRAYARDDGTRGWEALEEIVGGLPDLRSVGRAGPASRALLGEAPRRRGRPLDVSLRSRTSGHRGHLGACPTSGARTPRRSPVRPRRWR